MHFSFIANRIGLAEVTDLIEGFQILSRFDLSTSTFFLSLNVYRCASASVSRASTALISSSISNSFIPGETGMSVLVPLWHGNSTGVLDNTEVANAKFNYIGVSYLVKVW